MANLFDRSRKIMEAKIDQDRYAETKVLTKYPRKSQNG